LQQIMNEYEAEIVNAQENKVRANSEVRQLWEQYIFGNESNLKNRNIRSITPLLLTNWSQGTYYNTSCPADAQGQDGHVYVGCVAVALGQIMKFWNYPETGTGSKTSYSYFNGGYGNFTINFANETYNWKNMPNSESMYNTDLADFLFQAGVAVSMHWGPDGSASTTQALATALESYFKYSSNVNYVQRSDYTDTQWLNLMKGEIDAKRPVAYAGNGSGGGHEWNMDGYQSDQLHMNWGWGGAYNGYFTIDNLSPGGTTFDSGFDGVVNIYPEANYPEGCNTTTISGREGTFNDGSGNTNYNNNLNCTYLLHPACGSYIDLSFDRFNVEANDVVNIYDGSTTGAPLLESFTGANPPTSLQTITSSDSYMLVEFVTDNTGNQEGWYASYESGFCKSSRTITDASGTITDGSGLCDYENSTYCRWYIQPTNGATSINIDFTQWDIPTGETTDYLQIYAGTDYSSLLVKYTGADNPTSIVVPDGNAILRFISNSSNVSGGWTLNYSCVVGFNEQSVVSDAAVFPNPFVNDASVSVTLKSTETVTINVFNILGERVGIYSADMSAGKNVVPLSKIVDNVSENVYFVKIQTKDFNKMFKVISVK
ncbi:MAG: C10 family peptidase, partial [Bacteroidales bacterium]|nr:C10 family peptidase [Bacteroidales bacterium]